MSTQTSESTEKVPEPQWPLTIKLEHPFDFGTERIAALTMRRGKLGDLKGIKLGGDVAVDHILLVASRMCAQPLPVIESLAPDDAEKVVSRVLDFFAKCLGGGSTR